MNAPLIGPLITPPEAMNTGPSFYLGSAGGARGRGFEERVGAYARTEGGISYSPRSLSASLRLSLCLLKGSLHSLDTELHVPELR